MGSHTSRAYEQELSALKTRLLAMGARCESLIRDAAKALDELDPERARHVEREDRVLNLEEMAIDQMSVGILALRQPVGRDLRFLVCALKLVTDLERIGDEAVNIAERAVELSSSPPVASLRPMFAELVEASANMVRRALDAFVHEDQELARQVLQEDDRVDELYGRLRRAALDVIRAQPDRLEDGVRFANCAKYLERIADHATNVAELVIYLVSGDDVRHFTSSSQVDEPQ